MMKKAFIFDMDGVLFDTEDAYFNRRNQFLKEQGISSDHLKPRDFIGSHMSRTWHLVLGDAYEAYDVPFLQTGYETYKKEHPFYYPDLLFSGVESTLKAIKQAGYQLALASNSVLPDIKRALSSTGLETYFDVVLSGDEVSHPKPDPAIYQAALSRLGICADQALVIEDSEKGIAAAKAAGITVYAICDTRFGLDQSQADGLLTSIEDIKAMLKD